MLSRVMLRLTGRPRLDIFGLYGRGPLMNVPALFLANDGAGPAGGAPAVEGGLGAGLGTERVRLAVQLVDCTEPIKSPADAHTGVARWLRCQWTYVDRHIYDRSQTSTLANAFECKVVDSQSLRTRDRPEDSNATPPMTTSRVSLDVDTGGLGAGAEFGCG